MNKPMIVDLSPMIIKIVSIVFITLIISNLFLDLTKGDPIEYGTIIWMGLCIYFIN